MHDYYKLIEASRCNTGSHTYAEDGFSCGRVWYCYSTGKEEKEK